MRPGKVNLFCYIQIDDIISAIDCELGYTYRSDDSRSSNKFKVIRLMYIHICNYCISFHNLLKQQFDYKILVLV